MITTDIISTLNDVFTFSLTFNKKISNLHFTLSECTFLITNYHYQYTTNYPEPPTPLISLHLQLLF